MCLWPSSLGTGKVIIKIIFSLIGAVAAAGYYNSIWPYHIFGLNCIGNESSILNCSYNGLSNNVCPSSNDASVSCQSKLLSPRLCVMYWSFQVMILSCQTVLMVMSD